jgi:hypothetical protein
MRELASFFIPAWALGLCDGKAGGLGLIGPAESCPNSHFQSPAMAGKPINTGRLA